MVVRYSSKRRVATPVDPRPSLVILAGGHLERDAQDPEARHRASRARRRPTPAQTPSPAPFIGLSPPTSPRRAKNNQTATQPPRGAIVAGTPWGARATTTAGPHRARSRRTNPVAASRRRSTTSCTGAGPAAPPRWRAAASTSWLCVGSLRTMPLPAGTVACYAFIFALAASLFTRLFQRVRRNLGFGLGIGGMDAAAMESRVGCDSEKTRGEGPSVGRQVRRVGRRERRGEGARRRGDVDHRGGYRAMGPPGHHPEGVFPAVVRIRGGEGVVFSAGYTVALLWCALFTVPPFVAALGPAAGDAFVRAVTWYAGRWLNDRRVQLAIVGFVWSGTGVAGGRC